MHSVALVLSLVGLLACSAFFSAAETALFSLAPLRLRDLGRSASPADRVVARLMESPRAVLVTILLGNMLVNVLASAIASAAVLRETGNAGLGILVATVVMTFLILVLGEIAPKTVAYRHAEPIARAVAAPLLTLGRIVAPIRWLLLRLTDAVLGAERRTEDRVDPSEAEAMLRMAHAEGEVESTSEICAGFRAGNPRSVMDDAQRDLLDAGGSPRGGGVPSARGGFEDPASPPEAPTTWRS
jgi:Mg2+/Co2+ transporter CorB